MKSQTYFLVVDWSTTQDYTVNISLGMVNPPTGGTVNNAPTQQNSTGLVSSGSFGINPASVTTIASVKVHGSLATDGSVNVLMSRDFSMKFSSGLVIHLPTDTKSTDLFPVWLHVGSGIGTQNPGSGYAGTAGGTSTLDLTYTGNSVARFPDNSDGGSYGLILPSTTNMPDIADAFDGSFVMWPALIANNAANNNTIRGRLQDIYFLPYPLGVNVPPQGSVDNVSSPSYMLVGVFWFPTNAIPQIF